jgi:hypothetical protein
MSVLSNFDSLIEYKDHNIIGDLAQSFNIKQAMVIKTGDKTVQINQIDLYLSSDISNSSPSISIYTDDKNQPKNKIKSFICYEKIKTAKKYSFFSNESNILEKKTNYWIVLTAMENNPPIKWYMSLKFNPPVTRNDSDLLFIKSIFEVPNSNLWVSNMPSYIDCINNPNPPVPPSPVPPTPVPPSPVPPSPVPPSPIPPRPVPPSPVPPTPEPPTPVPPTPEPPGPTSESSIGWILFGVFAFLFIVLLIIFFFTNRKKVFGSKRRSSKMLIKDSKR